MTPLESVLNRLTDAKKSGHGWTARCPAHEDKRASLGIAEGDGGAALLHCFAGCSTDAICAALNIHKRDLFPVNGNGNGRSNPAHKQPAKGYPTAAAAIAALEQAHGPRAAMWTYHGADGDPVGVIARWDEPDGKRILPVSRNGAGWVIGGMPAPRPLYRLPNIMARPSERVYVVEGEKAADAGASIGLLSTTSPHGSQSAGKADWSPLSGRDVVIIPDNDAAGRAYADAVAHLLTGLNPPATVRVVELPGLEAGGDMADYVEARDSIESETIVAQIEALVAEAPEWVSHEDDTHDDETPAAAAVEPWRPFPVDALPDPMRDFALAVAAATGTDVSYPALASMVTAAGCVGNRAAALVKRGWVEPAVLWGALVGKSSVTKSPVLKLVTRALFDLYRNERERFAEAKAEHARDYERYNVDLADWKRSQRNGPATDPPLAPEAPIERRVVVSDITVEKLGSMLEDNPLGLLLVRDELASWVGSFDRYAAGGKGSDCPAWLSFYSAAPVVIDRKSGNGTIFCERGAVSVIGTIQPRTLARVFGTAEREAGLLGRVLLVNPPEKPAAWSDDELPENVAAGWRDLLGGLLSIQPSRDDGGEPAPRYLPLSDGAKRAWVAWHDAHARETADVDDDDLAACFGKLKGLCIRFALVLECVAVASGAGGRACITLESLQRAIQLAEWFKHEARRVYGQLGEAEDNREQRRLVEWIDRRGGAVTVRDVTHGVNRFRGDTKGARDALNALAEAGLGCWSHPAPGRSGGRPVQRFELVSGDAITKTPTSDPVGEGFGCGDTGDGDENADRWVEI